MLIGLLRFRNVVSIVIFFMIMGSIIALCMLIGNEESIFNYENRVVESEVIDFSRYSASLPSGTNCRIVIKEVVWDIPIVEKEMIKLNDRYVQPVYSSQGSQRICTIMGSSMNPEIVALFLYMKE